MRVSKSLITYFSGTRKYFFQLFILTKRKIIITTGNFRIKTKARGLGGN